MRLSLFTLRRMIAIVALALVVTAAGVAAPLAMAGPQAVVLQGGGTKLMAAADNGRMVVMTKNTETGATRTTTYNSDGSSKTEVTQTNGATTTTCNDKNNNPVPCP